MTLHKPCRPAAPLLVTVLALSAAGAMLAASSAEAAAGPPAGCTGPASQTWITVAVDGVRNATGLVAVTLYEDSSSKFLAKDGSLYVGRVDARSGTTRACIFVPKTGIYAFAIYHDENASRKFDRTGVGLPAEGYGFSNNPSTIAGLPAFRAVRLNVPKTGLTTHVQLKYP